MDWAAKYPIRILKLCSSLITGPSRKLAKLCPLWLIRIYNFQTWSANWLFSCNVSKVELLGWILANCGANYWSHCTVMWKNYLKWLFFSLLILLPSVSQIFSCFSKNNQVTEWEHFPFVTSRHSWHIYDMPLICCAVWFGSLQNTAIPEIIVFFSFPSRKQETPLAYTFIT